MLTDRPPFLPFTNVPTSYGLGIRVPDHQHSFSTIRYRGTPHLGALMMIPIKHPEMIPVTGNVMIQPM